MLQPPADGQIQAPLRERTGGWARPGHHHSMLPSRGRFLLLNMRSGDL